MTFRSLLLAVLVTTGCGGEGSGSPARDGGSDALACTPPNVDCESGLHSEYGVCIPDVDGQPVAAGAFEMGVAGAPDFPGHTVTLSAFTIDRNEVTNARYAACVTAGCCTPPAYDGSYTGRQPYFGNAEFAEFPVVFVTWDQALQYCQGIEKRLPTEAEWEFAARGPEGRPYPWGSDAPSQDLANYGMGWLGDTEQVGTHESGASASGALDMAGNVWEWVNDWYSATYYAESPATDPPGPATGNARVARGGSFGSTETELLSYYRGYFLPVESFSNLGFRCAW